MHPDLLEWSEIKELQAQGHEVHSLIDYRMPEGEFDLILGPNCWNMNEDLRPYLLTHALPEARRNADARKRGIM